MKARLETRLRGLARGWRQSRLHKLKQRFTRSGFWCKFACMLPWKILSSKICVAFYIKSDYEDIRHVYL